MTAIHQPAGGPGAAPGGALSIRGVGKTHRLNGRDLEVLNNVSLDVAPGEFISIVGASGCGKSTLLRLIVGLDNDYRGEIRLNDLRILSTSLERGIVFQDHRLFPWMTLEQNIGVALQNRRLPRETKRKLVAENLALVNLSGFEQAYPHQLSGGMAQRAAIARALVNEPKLLLLDEPFGALDALTRLKLQGELQALRRRTHSTMIMVTHDVEEALYLADRVVIMHGGPGRIGRIVAVPFNHPRDRGSASFGRLKDEILAELMSQSEPAPVSNLDDARRRLT
jgi:sulfonate transport system ATP-binding protein